MENSWDLNLKTLYDPCDKPVLYLRESLCLSAVLSSWPMSLWFLICDHAQVLEAARDVLNKSRDNSLTSLYFYDLSENLQRLLFEVCHAVLCSVIYNHTNTYVYISGVLCGAFQQPFHRNHNMVQWLRFLARTLSVVHS